MSQPDMPNESELQAYVDGQLTQERREQIEAYLQTHPEVAERLLAYQQQNNLLHKMFDPVLEEPLPKRLTNVTNRKNRKIFYRIAAVHAWLILGGILGFYLRAGFEPSVTMASSLSERAAIAHVVYSTEKLHPVEVGAEQESHLMHWLSKRVGHKLNIPKLSGYGYQLVGGRLLPGDKSAAAQFMYQTQTGARLTLYITAKQNNDSQTAFRIEEQDGQQVLYWVEDNLGFALIGETDRVRLLNIARETYKAMSF